MTFIAQLSKELTCYALNWYPTISINSSIYLYVWNTNAHKCDLKVRSSKLRRMQCI